MLLGRKAESGQRPGAPRGRAPAAPADGGRPGAGAQTDLFDAADRRGVGRGRKHLCGRRHRQRARREVRQETASSSSPGVQEGNRSRASSPTSAAIAVDAQGNVYVADGGNKRIQVFDSDGDFQDASTPMSGIAAGAVHHAGSRISSSTAPIQIRPTTSTATAKSTRWNWTERSSANSARPVKLPKEFGTVNAIDCRAENTLLRGRNRQSESPEADATLGGRDTDSIAPHCASGICTGPPADDLSVGA